MLMYGWVVPGNRLNVRGHTNTWDAQILGQLQDLRVEVKGVHDRKCGLQGKDKGERIHSRLSGGPWTNPGNYKGLSGLFVYVHGRVAVTDGDRFLLFDMSLILPIEQFNPCSPRLIYSYTAPNGREYYYLHFVIHENRIFELDFCPYRLPAYQYIPVSDEQLESRRFLWVYLTLCALSNHAIPHDIISACLVVFFSSYPVYNGTIDPFPDGSL
ncbi:hypothetical protein ABKN59_009385 [Abortiporus biennis]